MLKIIFSILILLSLNINASSLPAPASENKKENKISQTYKGDIRGLKSMMSDLETSNPVAHRQLQSDFKSLKSSQFKADVVWYGGYGLSTGLMVYGMFSLFDGFSVENDGKGTKFDFTPYLVSVALFYVTGWTYEAMRPSKQDYLDFTNKHNRLNPKQQLEWEKSSWYPIRDQKFQLASLSWDF